MKLLAFETATEALSVAVWFDGEVRERFELAPRRLGMQCDAVDRLRYRVVQVARQALPLFENHLVLRPGDRLLLHSPSAPFHAKYVP